MVHRSAAEILTKNKAVLGDDYGMAFHHCCQELWRVSTSWDRYQALFSTQERVDLLNRSGGNFWHSIQSIVFEDVLLGLCRLTDPAKSGRKTNLSVRKLLELDLSKHNVRLGQRVFAAERKAQFARTWRDKRIAHNDFEQITGVASKLAPATGRRVTGTILSIHEVLRWINAKHLGGDMGLIDMGDKDAVEVMSVIADGLKFDRLRQAEHVRGNYGTYERSFEWMGNGPDPMKRYEIKRDWKLPRGPRRR